MVRLVSCMDSMSPKLVGKTKAGTGYVLGLNCPLYKLTDQGVDYVEGIRGTRSYVELDKLIEKAYLI